MSEFGVGEKERARKDRSGGEKGRKGFFGWQSLISKSVIFLNYTT